MQRRRAKWSRPTDAGPASTIRDSSASCSGVGRRIARRSAVHQAVGALVVDPMGPVPHCLTVHAHNPRHVFPAHPLINRRHHRQPPRLGHIANLPCQPAHASGIKNQTSTGSKASHRFRAMRSLNHCSPVREIPRSRPQRRLV